MVDYLLFDKFNSTDLLRWNAHKFATRGPYNEFQANKRQNLRWNQSNQKNIYIFCEWPGFNLFGQKKGASVKGFTRHKPEIILNNFNTRLGLQVGRSFAAIFPPDPQYEGRHCITFHNQRDYIFFRHHRYIFRSAKKVGIQELGPKFTLKLRSLQKGTFDTKFGEYEWVQKRHEMEQNRRKFSL